MLNSISFKAYPHYSDYNYSSSIEGGVKNSSDEDFKKAIEDKVFTFEKANGDTFEGTIKEYFKSCIVNKRPTDNTYMYHCTTTKDVALDIIENGLDWTKTGRMKAGPGTYFSPSTMGGSEQGAGSVPIEGVYIGNKREYPVFEMNFYEAVDGHREIEKIASEFGEDTRKIVNKYCHDLLCDEMGIDFLYASTGRGTGAYAVLNNDCLRLSKCYW